MKKITIAAFMLIISFTSCVKRDGEDDDRPIIIKPPTPVQHPDSTQNPSNGNNVISFSETDSTNDSPDGEDDDRPIIIKP